MRGIVNLRCVPINSRCVLINRVGPQMLCVRPDFKIFHVTLIRNRSHRNLNDPLKKPKDSEDVQYPEDKAAAAAEVEEMMNMFDENLGKLDKKVKELTNL